MRFTLAECGEQSVAWEGNGLPAAVEGQQFLRSYSQPLCLVAGSSRASAKWGHVTELVHASQRIRIGSAFDQS